MTTLLFSDFAKTTLASPINATQTTATLAPGSGALFPSPTTGQGFYITFKDALTQLVNEIVLVTGMSGDSITAMIRAQEGTSAHSYLAGDFAANTFTANSARSMVQSVQLQSGVYTLATSVGGSPNAITATLASNLTTLPDGLPFVVESTAANTGAMTLTLTLGSSVQATYPIVNGANAALTSGAVPNAGFQMVLRWNAAYSAYVFGSQIPTGAPLNSPAFTGTPTAPTATTGTNTTQLATTAFVQSANALLAPLASPALTGTPTAPTAAARTQTTQVASTAFAYSTQADVQGAFSNSSVTSIGVNNFLSVIKADSLVLLNPTTGQYYTATNINLTTNISNSGALGLATGQTLNANTWYYPWVGFIPGTGLTAWMDNSPTAPTPPTGVTFYAPVRGPQKTDGSANKYLLNIQANNYDFQYVLTAGSNTANVIALASGSTGSPSTPTWTSVAVSGGVPPTATRIRGSVFTATPASQAIVAPNANYGAFNSFTNPPPVSSVGATGATPNIANYDFLLESANIYWASVGSSILTCIGGSVR